VTTLWNDAIGVASALPPARLLGAQLYGITPHDPAPRGLSKSGNLEVEEMANETERATKRERSGGRLSEGPDGTAAERRTRAPRR
jgi:hypothetical protein